MGGKRLAWALSALALLLPASASAKGDFGDAPDGVSAGYSNAAITGAFPSLKANGGPRHRAAGALVLGAGASAEADSRQVDTDSADDGAEPLLKACSGKSELRTVINATKLPRRKARTGDVFYVNAWFDWNRDGDWEDDDDRCAPEWAIENFPVSAAELERGILPLAIQFAAGSQVRELWHRVTLTRNDPVAYDDAGAPADGYAFGETEDHFIGVRGGGEGEGFNASCSPNPRLAFHGTIASAGFLIPPGFSSGLTASVPPRPGKKLRARIRSRNGVPTGVRYAEARDGPSRVSRRDVPIDFTLNGVPQKTVSCRFVVIHIAHRHGRGGRRDPKAVWRHWRRHGWRWRKYRRPRRTPHVELTEVPKNPESKLYAVTVRVKLQRLHKFKRKIRRVQFPFGRYKKPQRGKKLWAIGHSSRQRKIYRAFLRRCKVKALAASRRHAGRSAGRGGPAVLDCPVGWKGGQRSLSFDLNLNPADDAPLTVFLQDERGRWFQASGAAGGPTAPEEPPPPEPATLASQADFRFCRDPVAGSCTDNEPNTLIRFDLVFQSALDGFLINLGASRTVLGGNVLTPAGFTCVPENGDGANDVLRCLGPIQPGTQVAGIFQTSTPLDPCEQLMLLPVAAPGSPLPPGITTHVRGSTPCP